MGIHGHGAVEILHQGTLESCAPSRYIGRQSVQSKADRIEVKAGIDSTSSKESPLWVGVVEILYNSRHTHAFVIVQGVLKGPLTRASEIDHEVFAHQAARIC